MSSEESLRYQYCAYQTRTLLHIVSYVASSKHGLLTCGGLFADAVNSDLTPSSGTRAALSGPRNSQSPSCAAS